MKRKNLAFILLIGVLIAHVMLWVMGVMRAPNTQDGFTPEINPEKPMVALTFDDGPDALFTPQVLDLLSSFRVSATFFVSGKNIPGNEKIVKATVNDGHELANHTYSHEDLRTLELQEIEKEIARTQGCVKQAIPEYVLRYVRPPYGRYDEKVLMAFEEPMVLWDVDSEDWHEEDPMKIYSHVVSNVESGDIIIMHDNGSATLEALKLILPVLQEKEYQFVTISQLAQYRTIDMRW